MYKTIIYYVYMASLIEFNNICSYETDESYFCEEWNN